MPRAITIGALLLIVPVFVFAGTGDGIESSALAERAPADSGTMFERLDAERTGVDFVHQWVPAQRYLIQLDNGMVGGGVAVGDYDGDGRADLYLSRPLGGGRLYRNLGDFRFEDVTSPAGIRDVTWGTGASFADIDGDGDLDLYVCGYDTPNRLFVNRGDGTFEERAGTFGLDFKGASVMMSFADYDLDGDLDGYLLTNRVAPSRAQQLQIQEFRRQCHEQKQCEVPEALRELQTVLPRPDVGGFQIIDAAQADHLYRNNGDGSFTDVSEKAGIRGNDFGLSATWWDYDGDGLPDLYVSNDFYGSDQLLRNDGDGTFTDAAAAVLPHTPWFSMGSDTVDIDNDGRLDFVATDMASTDHYKSKLTMGDMESAGWFLVYPDPHQYMRNAVYLNSGTGRFLEVAQITGLAATDWTWSVKAGDLDNDGRVDLLFSNGMTRYWFNSDLRREAARAVERGEGDMRVWLDSPKRAEPNLTFRNLGDLRFESVGEAWGLDHVGVSFGAALADLDRDGDLDLVVNNFEEPVGIYRNGSTEGHRVLIRLVGRSGNSHGVGATVRVRTGAGEQVRYATLARGFASANESVAHFGLGGRKTIDRLTVSWPGGHVQVFDDLVADRIYTVTEPVGHAKPTPPPDPAPTIFERSEVLKGIRHRETPYDDFQRQPLLPHKLSRLGPGLAWGDVDGDGDDDLYVGGAAGHPGALYLRTGNGQFEQAEVDAFVADRASEDMAPLFLDTDGDADVDLYVVSGGVECAPGDEVLRDRLYLNDGKGGLVRAPEGTLPDLRDSGSIVAAADYDHDGDLDLFVGGRSVPGEYPRTPESRLLSNAAGRFTDVTDRVAPGLRRSGLVTGAVWSDADGDGWIDLLVTHEWGPVKLWRNDEGNLVDRTAEAGLADRFGWFYGIAARDIDNDSDIDYVVTNRGLNTKYHPSVSSPSRLYYGAFGDTPEKRLIEAKFEDEVSVPVRGKSCSTNAMPHLAEQFETFDEFARATLPEIYTTEELDESLMLEVNTAESYVLINDGKAGFKFDPLPRRAQISPGFGVALTEVDGDGNTDLYVVQNFFSPEPETGRMDGGLSLLLRGSGDGGFEPIGADISGLVVPGDAKGLTVADLDDDGWVDFVVGVNDDELMAFENRGSSRNRVVVVRLRGSTGNSTAVGARVTVHLDNGSTQTAEVHAGASYLSQSSGDLVFGLGPSAAVARIDVRWPDGRTSTALPPFTEGRISIEQPSTSTSATGRRR